jgi:hypothetical protein
LHSWLGNNIDELIAFVQTAAGEAQPQLRYDRLVVQSTYALALLSGELIPSETSPREVFLRLIRFAKSSEKSPFNRLNITDRSAEWQKTITSVQKEADKLLSEFLTLLNCPQGDSSKVLFVDAARGMMLLDEMRAKRMVLEMHEFPDSKSKISEWGTIYRKLAERLPIAVDAEWESLIGLYADIVQYVGDSPEDTFNAIHSLTTQNFSFRAYPAAFTGKKLQNRLQSLKRLQEMDKDDVEGRHGLSASLELKRELLEYLKYFADLSSHLNREGERIQQALNVERSEAIESQRQAIAEILNELSALIASLKRDE